VSREINRGKFKTIFAFQLVFANQLSTLIIFVALVTNQ
jgi:hypothetical protein